MFEVSLIKREIVDNEVGEASQGHVMQILIQHGKNFGL